MLSTAFGVAIGPYGANIFNPRAWTTESNAVTIEVMRVVLATGVFAIGIELPMAYLFQHIRSLAVTVIPTMALGWVVSAGTSVVVLSCASRSRSTAFIKALFPPLNFISALVISACLTPTDPVSPS